MQIFIKTLTGKRSNFNFEPENTVRQVKEALQVREHFLLSINGIGTRRNTSGTNEIDLQRQANVRRNLVFMHDLKQE